MGAHEASGDLFDTYNVFLSPFFGRATPSGGRKATSPERREGCRSVRRGRGRARVKPRVETLPKRVAISFSPRGEEHTYATRRVGILSQRGQLFFFSSSPRAGRDHEHTTTRVSTLSSE